MATRLRSTFAQAITPVAAGAGFLVLLGLGLWGCAAWSSGNAGEESRLEVNLGEDEFNVGPADERAEAIAERGPLLFPGLLGADEGYIVVSHTGTDPLKGWRAFVATPEGAAIECTVSWIPDRQQLVDPCTGTAYPVDGTGLTQFQVLITPDDEVLVDLTPEGRPGGGASTVPSGAGG